ncbi:AsnC family transcriptional regulator [Streptacidiphilus sp. PB12-B1b]|uniref:Lrp/AsnC family transcriptional regulator n=1 Tax=Streptacidiphilus sp. PB12-B1b TaxID=2705012 RepID=UPI0015F7B179|nr:AsnC family transcriptional regulator [Streptacidiphilus sp. PB12-B1b]QMU78543.1 AsnC family transcriptional regulator [Streptacidiphilus sp. PB12-B1b]
MRSDSFDELDRQLVNALQLDPRIPFSRLASVLGVSDQTVARRYSRLRTEGLIRVLGLTDPEVLGEDRWMVRVQCTPDAASAIAEALARRDDTTWVSLNSGGTEISCVARAGVDQEEHALLLQRLPRTPSVVGVTAHCVMHTFFGGAMSLVTKWDTLAPEQVALLTPPPPSRGAERPVRLDEGDKRLLAVLAQDGRASLGELAAATGWSQSTVRRRMAELHDSGALYFDMEFERRIFDLTARALLWLSVAPAELAATGEALAEHPEVAYACATTGATNVHAVVFAPDTTSLYTYLTTRIASLPAIRQVETTPIMRQVKGASPLPARPLRAARLSPAAAARR